MKFRINFLAIWPNAYRPAGWSIMDIFKGVVTGDFPGKEAARLLEDEDIRIIGSAEAKNLGTGAAIIDGVTVCVLIYRRLTINLTSGLRLTNLIWMLPTPRTTVIEFISPGSFAHDYVYTARSLGIAHYGFWGAQSFPSWFCKRIADYQSRFHFPHRDEELTAHTGNSILIDTAAVGRLVYDRLSIFQPGWRGPLKKKSK
ncbi:hypothetical protein B0H13DRAFT_1876225 [Mycena leptocephala]|nr:hypothetical protein B0H13DRAFT_1876225 [Mycena leptocephala]